MPFSDLSASQYLALGTWRKNGKVVDTTVWFAQEGDQLLVFSSADAGKVKRLRNFTDATIARCTATGKVTGEVFEADAYLLEGADEKLALKALHRKYGFKMKVADFFSGLTGKTSKRAYIRVDPR